MSSGTTRAPLGDLSAATEPHPDSFIRFRLSVIDSVPTYETSPYDNRRSPYSKELLRQVPVIRIFGATDKGQRVCAHVHGVFPYVYVEYKGKLDPDSVNDYIRKFGASLNSAMALSLPTKHKQGQSPQYVAFIVLCKGVPFYGYHVGYRPFLKIYMVHPTHKSRLSQCLRSGAVLGTEFDVFEDHIPFLLQFMLDSNLYGCGWVEVGECLFREGVPEYEPPSASEALFTPPPTCQGPYAHRIYVDLTVPPSRFHPPGGPNKVSYSALELDLPSSAILNRGSNPARKIHHDFVEKLHPELVEKGKLVRSVKELWDDERRRRTARGESGPYDLRDDAPREFDSRDPKDSIWRTGEQLQAKVEDKAAEDLKAYREKMGPRGKGSPDFETYVEEKEKKEGRRTHWMDRIKTTFEQVDAIYISRFEQDERETYEFGAWAVKGIGTASRAEEKEWEKEIHVDMGRLLATQAEESRRVAQERVEKAKNNVLDDGSDADRDPDEVEEDLDDERTTHNDGLPSQRPPATQAEAIIRRDRKRADRAEQRGREGSVEEGEWDKEPSDDDEAQMEFWRLRDADTASERAASEALLSPASSRTLASSPLRPSSPLKPSSVRSPSSSPTKRSRLGISSTEAEDDPRPSKRLARETPVPAQTPLTSAPDSTPRKRKSLSPTTTRTPSKPAQIFSPSTVTPTRRFRANPLSSSKKAVGVRFAQRDSPIAPRRLANDEADEELEEEEPLFGDDRIEEESPTKPSPISRVSPRVESAAVVPRPRFVQGKSAPPARSRIQLTPSELLAEMADLPLDAFDEYQPTPTVVQSPCPSPSPRSSADQQAPVLSTIDSETEAEEEEEVEESSHDAKSSVETLPPPKKRVNFEILDTSSGSTVVSQSTVSNPATSTSESQQSLSGAPAQVSQTTTDSDSTMDYRPVPPASRFPLSRNSVAYAPKPPTTAQLYANLREINSSDVVYKDPYYSKPKDVPSGPREFGGKKFSIEGSTLKYLKPFLNHGMDPELVLAQQYAPVSRIAGVTKWEFAERPPSKKLMQDWLVQEGLVTDNKPRFNPLKSQIEGPTQKGDGYKFTSIAGAPSHREKQHMAVLALELHVNTRGTLLPDPKEDPIEAVFYCLQSDNEDLLANGRSENTHVGAIVVGDESLRKKLGPTDYVLELVEDERQLVEVLLEKVRFEFDPECLSGFEVHHGSWGYLLERSDFALDWNLVPELGRVKSFDTGKFGNKDTDRWGFNQSSTLNFSGRHVLPIWRILKADNKFQQNSFEHIALHVLRLRTPHFSFAKLTEWYKSGDPSKMARVLGYWRNRVEMNVEMLEAAEIIDQNCESARVFGVDFKSVRTRGSQFKVESVMFKIAKPESFLLLSPNRVQVGRQNAAECQPLIMEPRSAFYKGPLLVLDFQSLYPSVMIAYNYCYSTFLGRVNSFKGTSKFGVQTNLDQPPGLLHLMKDHINISPNGMMFVKPEVRKSLLSKMLSELLDTRVMVKGSMKAVASDRALTKLLNARQLALKFLANVTYGYTSATFSGRMPAVEVADAIVQTGRETLERAIVTIKNKKEWNAQVVYGDTDSLFIYLPGRSKEDAFRIGNEMANQVTSENPRPIKLKFEKVYLPCVLLAKKRYVGFKYEHLSELEPEFDAKGIETVRRDGIPATQKMQEKCLKILFRSSDLSQVKEYCWQQWTKLRAGDVSPQDFVIAKKVSLGTYATGRDPPPGAMVASRAMEKDHRAEPEYGERVPYILFSAQEGTKQIDRSVSPGEFLSNPAYRLDVNHYIKRMMIPPLSRIFDLVGASVAQWYEEMPKTQKIVKGGSIADHFESAHCVACKRSKTVPGPLCRECQNNPAEVAFSLEIRKAQLESRQQALHKICASCSSTPIIEAVACDSLDCPNTYTKVRNDAELAKLRSIEYEF
ncbi:DNA-directed DNA polymerase [Sporobolomyces salmoneus]|uniref:DNA-directed DNA polymerase n=1 Tax=Sporobolomyces salmoneus TaxID=183962 RepID=UPI0031736568